VIDGMPVIDAVVHAYNLHPSNYATKTGEEIAPDIWANTWHNSLPGYRLEQEDYLRDWSMEETASLCFVESDTDIAVHHALPLFAFGDGGASLAKTIEAQERWPDRIVSYCGVDAMGGQAALDEIDRQVEILDPVGLKLYPNSWAGNQVRGWRMDDPEIAYPLFERAQHHGLKVVAIHKAVPLGRVPLEHYRVDDVDRAAADFPDLNFEIVHGGMAFLEETAWQLQRFPNVFVNLEITTFMAATRPAAFAQVMATMIQFGGEKALQQILWGTGAMAFHPQPHLEAFARTFDFGEDVAARYGVPPLTEDHKRDILARNYARMIGLDLDERLARIADDDFARARAGNGPAPAFSTTQVAGRGR
jgi:uncharacterized protein